jgi:hypothetical protein
MGPRNRFQGMNSASLCSLAGRYDNPLPLRFLAPIDSLKITALTGGCDNTICRTCTLGYKGISNRRDVSSSRVASEAETLASGDPRDETTALTKRQQQTGSQQNRDGSNSREYSKSKEIGTSTAVRTTRAGVPRRLYFPALQ